MSRDWTPREAYYFDKRHYEQYGEHFHQMTWYVEVEGKRVKEHPTEKEEELAKKYPYLTYTGCDILRSLEKTVNEDVLVEVESYVKELCENDTFQNKEHTPNSLQNESINQWYNGELDSGFYYREWNDRYLLEYLSEIKDPNEIRNPKEHEVPFEYNEEEHEVSFEERD